MKKAQYIFFIFLFFLCSGAFCQGKKERNKQAVDTVSIDSIEYELLILDPGFESWLITKPSKEYYSNDYYAYRNRIYVSEWNYRYSINKSNGEYDSYIDYEPGVEYDLDLNYRLYYYFRYFEEKYGTKLYPGFR
jgi:hypothetical protein